MDGQNSTKVMFDPVKLEEYSRCTTAIQQSTLSEEFRAMKREVLRAAFSHDAGEPNRNRIMITSLHEREGKTFTAVNLACSVSLEQDKRVMLVDVNVLAPTISKMVTPTPEKGLIDYLIDATSTVPEVIYTTDIERLRVLPMGSQHRLANELLSSHSMVDLMSEFRDRYNDRLVIFDAPPLLGVNEALTLSQHVDQIVIVIESGRVSERELREIRRQLPPNAIVHYVLNKMMHGRKWKRSTVNLPDEQEMDSSVNGASALN